MERCFDKQNPLPSRSFMKCYFVLRKSFPLHFSVRKATLKRKCHGIEHFLQARTLVALAHDISSRHRLEE